MLKAFIDYGKCLRCERCFAAEVCPTKAIYKMDLNGLAVIEREYCHGCGDCLDKCPGKAITIKEI